MTYQVDRYNGTFLTRVEDGTIDTTTDLKFVGRNYSGYGEVQNENFLHLLENFSNSVAPEKPISGQIWFDTSSKKLKFYDGFKFRTASGAEASSSPPNGLSIGDLWFDNQTNQLSAWNGSSFILIGPQSAPGFGTSQIVTEVVKDNNNTSHVILRAVVGGITTAIFSNDDDFTLSSTNNLAGFSETGRQIKKGVTLNSVNSTGVSDSSGYRFWGTTSNSERLGGETIDKFVRTDAPGGFTAEVAFANAGFTIGNPAKDLKFYINADSVPSIENQNNGKLSITISNAASTTDKDDMMIFSRQQAFTGDANSAYSVYPGTSGKINFGLTNRRWATGYFTNLYGELVGNVHGDVIGSITGDLLKVSGTTVIKVYNSATDEFQAQTFRGQLDGNCTGQAATAITANRLTNLDPSESASGGTATIPIRTANGTITAVLFNGTAQNSNQLGGKNLSNQKLADTIALRTLGGDLEARYFNGTATSARYADLAEIYKTDSEYPVGTVVSVGGAEEVTACKFGDRAIGTISANPAYLMNSEAEGQAVALKGRVPCMVSGTCKKGDKLQASDNGSAIVTAHHTHDRVFAIALENKDSPQVGLIEVIIL